MAHRHLRNAGLLRRKIYPTPKPPTFESYSVTSRGAASKAKLGLSSNPVASRYRTVLRRAMTEGPNFAGHYRVAIWGCGTSRAMFAVINLKTGRVITPEGLAAVSGVTLAADDFLPSTDSDGWGFRYERGSTLLVVLGALDENESREGAYYLVLKGEQLRPVHSTVVKKNCANLRPLR